MSVISTQTARFTVDDSAVTKSIARMEAQFSGLDRQMAALGKGTTAKIGADTSSASKALSKTTSDLDRIAKGTTARVGADSSGASKVFGKVSSFLERIGHGATAPVTADSSLAARTFAAVQSRLDSLAHGVTVPIRAEQQGSGGLAGEKAMEADGAKGGSAFAGGVLGSLTKLKVAIPALIGGSILASGLKRLTTIQDATVALKNLLGSEKAAAQFTAAILKTVTGTPFNLDQFLQAGKNLVAFNVPAAKVPGILTAIGDAAASTGKGQEAVDQLTTTFGKMAAQGSVQLDDVWSIAGAGIPALQILANGFGVTTKEIQKMISNGAVPAQKAIDVLTAGIEHGSEGMAGHTNSLAGSMSALRKTFNGSFGGMKAAAARLGAKLLAPVIGPATTGMTWLASRMDDVGRGFDSLLKKAKPFADLLATKVQPVIDAVSAGWQRLTSAFSGGGGDGGTGRASKAMVILHQALAAVAPLARQLGGVLASAFGAIKAAVTVIAHFVVDIWDRYGGQFLDHVRTQLHNFVQIFRGVFQILGGLFDFLRDLLTGKWGKLWDDLTKIFAGVWNVVVGLLKTALNIVSNVIGLAMAVISSLWFRAWHGLHRMLAAAWGLIERAVSTAVDAVVGFFADMWGRIERVAKAVWNVLWNTIFVPFRVAFAVISAVVGWFVGVFQRAWTMALSTAKTVWNVLWNTVLLPLRLGFALISDVVRLAWEGIKAAWSVGVTALTAAWGLISSYVIQPLGKAFGWLGDVVEVLWSGIQAAWQFGLTFLTGIWNAIYGFVLSPLVTAFNWVAGAVTAAWSLASAGVSFVWEKVLKPALQAVPNFLHNVVGPAFDWIRDHLSAAWGGLASLVKGIWDGITNGITAAINGIRSVIAGILGAAASVAGFLHLSSVEGTLRKAQSAVAPGKSDTRQSNPNFMGPVAESGLRIGSGFTTRGPQVLVGEGNPAYPEYVVPTDPKHRRNAMALFAGLGNDLGVMPRLAGGGILGGIGNLIDKAMSAAGGFLGGAASYAIEHVWPVLGTDGNPFQAIPAGAANTLRSGVLDFVKGLGGGGGAGTSGVNIKLPPGMTFGPTTNPAMLAAVMAAVRAHESGGNYRAQNPYSTASGAYQVLDSTWAHFGGFARAMYAPPAVQDSFARTHMAGALAQYGVPGVAGLWYVGDPRRGLDPRPVGGAGNTGSVLDYTRWLERYIGTHFFADGGIALARPGGTLGVLGERGRDEAVIPLPKAWRALSSENPQATVVIAEGAVQINGPVYGIDDLDAKMREVTHRLGSDLDRKLAKR